MITCRSLLVIFLEVIEYMTNNLNSDLSILCWKSWKEKINGIYQYYLEVIWYKSNKLVVQKYDKIISV